MLKSLGTLGDMPKMFKAAQQMQGKMAELQAELEKMEFMGESGAGLVRATVNAKGKLIALEIDPSIFHPDEKQVVEDLIIAAIRDAQQKGEEKARRSMEELTSSLGLPPGIQLPF